MSGSVLPRRTFYSRDYQKVDGKSDPLVEVNIVANGKKLDAYADTGCTSGLAITKKHMEKERLDLGQKINSEPIRCVLADGTIIGADCYIVDLKVGEETRNVRITVVDPGLKLGVAREDQTTVYLGRGFFDYFSVTFSGIRKKITLSKTLRG